MRSTPRRGIGLRWSLMACGLAVVVAVSAGCRMPPPEITGPTKTYYAACNLKVLQGNQIDYFNWQSATFVIPVGHRLEVAQSGGRATLTDPEGGAKYHLNAGGAEFMHKFLSEQPPSLDGISEEARANIANAVARMGMTKEEVYFAMGPPYRVGANQPTTHMTRDQVMSQNLWIYARRRFGKNAPRNLALEKWVVN